LLLECGIQGGGIQNVSSTTHNSIPVIQSPDYSNLFPDSCHFAGCGIQKSGIHSTQSRSHDEEIRIQDHLREVNKKAERI